MTVYDPKFDVTTTTQNPTSTPTSKPTQNPTPTPTSTPTPRYIGGHRCHKFTITCMDIPQNGVSKTVAHVFQET